MQTEKSFLTHRTKRRTKEDVASTDLKGRALQKGDVTGESEQWQTHGVSACVLSPRAHCEKFLFLWLENMNLPKSQTSYRRWLLERDRPLLTCRGPVLLWTGEKGAYPFSPGDGEGRAHLSDRRCCTHLSWGHWLFSDSVTASYVSPTLSSFGEGHRKFANFSHLIQMPAGSFTFLLWHVGEERIHYFPFERSNTLWIHYWAMALRS